MSTATTSTEPLHQIGELTQRASEIKSEYSKIMKEISDLAAGEIGSNVPKNAPNSGNIVNPVPMPKRRGRPPANPSAGSSSTNSTEAPKRRGRPPKNSNGSMSLKKAIFEVLDRDNWDGILNKEDDEVALSAGEIKKVIETEGKWTSTSTDITSQLQGALRDLRKMELIVWENHKYYVPKGVSYPS